MERIRILNPPYRMWLTGQAVVTVDYVADLRSRAWLAAAIVVLATFVLLFLMTGSVLVPVKALLMNVVSLGATSGSVVWGFQDGALEGLLGFSSAGGVETFVPPIVLALRVRARDGLRGLPARPDRGGRERASPTTTPSPPACRAPGASSRPRR